MCNTLDSLMAIDASVSDWERLGGASVSLCPDFAPYLKTGGGSGIGSAASAHGVIVRAKAGPTDSSATRVLSSSRPIARRVCRPPYPVRCLAGVYALSDLWIAQDGPEVGPGLSG